MKSESLGRQTSLIFHYLPKTLSKELVTFRKLLGKYRIIQNQDSIWKMEMGDTDTAMLIPKSSVQECLPLAGNHPHYMRIVSESPQAEIAILTANISMKFETEYFVNLRDSLIFSHIYKQVFFKNGTFFIIYWENLSKDRKWIDNAVELYFEGEHLIWKTIDRIRFRLRNGDISSPMWDEKLDYNSQSIFYHVTKYKMERVINNCEIC